MKRLYFSDKEVFPGCIVTNNRAFDSIAVWDSYALSAIAKNASKDARTAILSLYGVGMSIFNMLNCFERAKAVSALSPCNTA